MTLAPGRNLGPYEIEAPAGAGGMGEVYRAKDTRLNRIVAIKVLPENLVSSQDARARFEREAKTISSLNHPNICTLHDIGHDDGIDYLVMEFLDGETIEKRLKKAKFGVTEVLAIGAQIAGALDAAHRKGLVHRDLKPGNVCLTKEGAKLLDFGLAKSQPHVAADTVDKTQTAALTKAHTIVGTLQYMSPEQLEGHEADARSDIFSLGATLYEMLTGDRAFSGDSRASLIGSIMRETPQSVAASMTHVSPALERVIQKCLAKDPDDRWQTARDLKDELQWIASDKANTDLAGDAAGRSNIRVRMAYAIAFVVILASAIFYYQMDRERARLEEASLRASKGQQFLSDVLTSSFPPGYGDKITVLDIIDRASEKLSGAFVDEPEIEANLRQSLGLAYMRIAHIRQAEKELLAALNLYRQTLGNSHEKTLEILDELWLVYRILGDGTSMVSIVREKCDALTATLGRNHPTTLFDRARLAYALENNDQVSDAVDESMDVWEELKSTEGIDDIATIENQVQLAWLVSKSGDHAKAATLARDAHARATSILGESDNVTRTARSCLSAIYLIEGNVDSAKALYGHRKVPDQFGIERVFHGTFDLAEKPFQLLVFFETWCPFSFQKMNDLVKIDRQYRQFGLNISALTRVNRSASDAGVTEYIEQLGIEFAVVKENGRSWNYFDCQGTPSIFLLHEGHLVWEKDWFTSDAISIPMLEGMVAALERKSAAKSSAPH